MASSNTVGSPSRFPSSATTHGAANTAASRTTEITWSCGSGPRKRTRSPRPELVAQRAQRFLLVAGSHEIVPGTRSRTGRSTAAARSRSANPFFSTSRPTAAITGARSRGIAPREGGQVQAVVDATDASRRRPRSDCAGTRG